MGNALFERIGSGTVDFPSLSLFDAEEGKCYLLVLSTFRGKWTQLVLLPHQA